MRRPSACRPGGGPDGYPTEQPLPPDTEVRPAGLTELVATAIADAQARTELRGYADEQAALRRGRAVVGRRADQRRGPPVGRRDRGIRDGPALPADTETRLAGITELIATALAKAEAQTVLSASRVRLVAAADATHRRIERDLHDGAQQRLVSLALELRAVRTAVPPGADELTSHLDSVATELTGVLDELREIARGLHPAALADGGLRPALKTLARRSAVPVRLDVRVEGRFPEPTEVAVYYVVAEALTNVAKHAHATVVDVEVDVGEGVLHVRVRDDGRGGADVACGSGLVGLRDRVEALGGRLWVQTAPGAGTTVHGGLPLR